MFTKGIFLFSALFIFSSLFAQDKDLQAEIVSMKDYFKSADIDADGNLTLKEYRGMVRLNTIRHLKDKEFPKGSDMDKIMDAIEEKKFKGIDTDNDGLISLDEHIVDRTKAYQRKLARKAK